MTCTAYHQFEFEKPPKDTVMSGYIFQKDNAFFGFQIWHGMNNLLTEIGDPVKFAPLDVDRRLIQL